MIEPYLILQGSLSFQEEIKKSRFITYLAHVDGKQSALDYLLSIKQLHKEARHHCWAYIAAAPKDSTLMGCSDDGEPRGTAGKPMLSVLQGTNVGEIMAVVVRYSGGIKLGTGGLVRAYSNGIQKLVAQMPTIEKRFYQQYQLHCDYAQMALIESLLTALSGRIVQVEYLQSVHAKVEVDMQFCGQFIAQLSSQTQGKVLATKISPEVSKQE
ncbi:MAG: YigZ family protein [Psychromonas sp.]|nr:YigZ family protein [Psychromonas sp.]